MQWSTKRVFSAIHYLIKTNLFQGPINKRVLRHITAACLNSTYEIFGKIISLFIIHGGSEPSFFAPSVVNYLMEYDMNATLDDVPCLSIQSSLQKVNNILI